MDSFQAIIGWKRMGKRENTKFQKNCKKIQHIKKNTNIATFLAKIGWKRM